ncbi:MAG TPA: hypothetical protein DIV47_03960 [Candidatus Pacebacteria bacterium]|nr:hypothetical protein [Candidatus Paceibacterota bacterium]
MGVFLIISDNGDQLSLIRVDKGDGKSEIIQRPDRLTIDQIIQDPQPAKLPALESAMAWLP